MQSACRGFARGARALRRRASRALLRAGVRGFARGAARRDHARPARKTA
jgi:hypothetical protein